MIFIPKQVNNPYFDAAATGAQTAADQLCGEFSQVGPQNANAAEQVPFITDATTQAPSGIAISAEGPMRSSSLNAAMEQGVQVVATTPARPQGPPTSSSTRSTSAVRRAAGRRAVNSPDCTCDRGPLGSETATNQNAWIALMTDTLANDAKYANLDLVTTVYGNDDPQDSATQAQGLLQTYPDLKVIVAPTTVGILAAAQVVKQQGSDVKVTGLGFPNDMREYVKDGISPVFGLWSVPDLGYLTYYIASLLVDGTVVGAEGKPSLCRTWATTRSARTVS